MIVVQAVFECWECKDLKRLFLWVIGKKTKVQKLRMGNRNTKYAFAFFV